MNKQQLSLKEKIKFTAYLVACFFIVFVVVWAFVVRLTLEKFSLAFGHRKI